MNSYSHVRGAIGLGVLAALLASTAVAKKDDEEGGGWKPRVQQLEAAVAALQVRHLPVEAGVDCGSGGSINAALAANAEGEGLLTITVTGTCTEAVRIARDNVVLKGAGGAVVQAPAGTTTFIINVGDNVRNVTISDLTVAGSSTAAVLAHKGAHVVVKNSILQQAGTGVMALDNGVVDVTGSTLRNNNNGAYAARGGVVYVTASTIENNSVGVIVFKGGFANLTSVAHDYVDLSTGPTVASNTTGILVRSGGVLDLADTVIQNNIGNGIVVDSGGVAHFFSRLNGNGTRVSGNQTGVLALRNSSLVFSDNTTAITANVRGIQCSGNPSYMVPAGFSGVAGNTAGDILGCIP